MGNEGSSDSERQAKALADKAEAEARAAQIAADKAAREEAEQSSELARQARDAEARQKVAEADKVAADAKRANFQALIPDFTTADGGTTTVTGEQPMFSSLLAHRSLDQAAMKLVDHVKRCLGDNARVLVTDDPDLASTDAAYLEVSTGQERLLDAAEKLLTAIEETGKDETTKFEFVAGTAAAPALGALASALPSIASLISGNRSVKSFATTVDNTAAMATIAGLMAGAGRKVQLDDFRLVPQGRIARQEKRVQEQRAALWEAKLDQEQTRLQSEELRVEAVERIDKLKKQLAEMKSDDPARHEIENELEDDIEERDRAADDVKSAALIIGMIDNLVSTIDSFNSVIHTVPANGTRSPFVAAALREQLRGPRGGPVGGRRFNNVLFIKAISGSADQMLSDLPLWSKDRFHTMGSVSLSYWLMDTETSEIIIGGVATGSAQLTGKIGERFTISQGE